MYDIRDIQRGARSRTLRHRKLTNKTGQDEFRATQQDDMCLSFVLDDRTIDFVFLNADDLNIWLEMLSG